MVRAFMSEEFSIAPQGQDGRARCKGLMYFLRDHVKDEHWWRGPGPYGPPLEVPHPYLAVPAGIAGWMCALYWQGPHLEEENPAMRCSLLMECVCVTTAQLMLYAGKPSRLEAVARLESLLEHGHMANYAWEDEEDQSHERVVCGLLEHYRTTMPSLSRS